MNGWRTDAIEAGARALLRPDVYGLTLEDAAEFAAAVVDAVAPIIRAEAIAEVREKHRAERALFLADLRARVEGLRRFDMLPPHDPDCPGRPGWRGICTCHARIVDAVVLSDVLRLLDEVAP